MLLVERFINELMTSNCFIVWDNENKHCVVIDPGSFKCENEILFIEHNDLIVDYIILTHEHTDHTWGCNTLIDKYDCKVICSKICEEEIPNESQAYFRFYFDDKNYTYSVKRIDYTIESLNNQLSWNNYSIDFIPTPGHSKGSICIFINNMLFSGDTIMMYKPYINKKNGSLDNYKLSVRKLISMFKNDIMIYPGHGDCFLFKKFLNSYDKIFRFTESNGKICR